MLVKRSPIIIIGENLSQIRRTQKFLHIFYSYYISFCIRDLNKILVNWNNTKLLNLGLLQFNIVAKTRKISRSALIRINSVKQAFAGIAPNMVASPTNARTWITSGIACKNHRRNIWWISPRMKQTRIAALWDEKTV